MTWLSFGTLFVGVIVRNVIPIQISTTVFGITVIAKDYDGFLSTIVMVGLFTLIFAQFFEKIDEKRHGRAR